ncbi:MAG: hypothetical protein ACOCRB_00265 [Halanaerobiaceae bacterium]
MFSFNKKIMIILILIILLSISAHLEAVSGLITEVDLEKRAVKIENKWYFLQEKTVIKRNNNKVNLKSCQPIQGYEQWADLKFNKEDKLSRIEVKYQIIEGEIVDIKQNKDKGIIVKLQIFKDTGTQNSEKKFNIDKKLMENLNLKKGINIVIIKSGPKILDIKKI